MTCYVSDTRFIPLRLSNKLHLLLTHERHAHFQLGTATSLGAYRAQYIDTYTCTFLCLLYPRTASDAKGFVWAATTCILVQRRPGRHNEENATAKQAPIDRNIPASNGSNANQIPIPYTVVRQTIVGFSNRYFVKPSVSASQKHV